jgi:hypothetical protein
MICHPPLFFKKKYISDTSPSKVDDVPLASQFSGHHCNGENVRAKFFFCQKTLNFKVISTQNHFMDILETLTNQSINSKHPKIGSKT